MPVLKHSAGDLSGADNGPLSTKNHRDSMSHMSKIIATRKGRKAKSAVITLPSWDKGAEGPANQPRMRVELATFEDPETGREQPTGGKRRRRQSWVQIYARKGELSATQLLAAERLARAAEGYPDRDPLAAVLAPVKSLGQSDPQAAWVDAREQFRRMWGDVPGSSKPVLQRVVLEDQAIWHGNLPQRDRHMQRLRDGLDAIS